MEEDVEEGGAAQKLAACRAWDHYRKQTNIHRQKTEEHMLMAEEPNLCSSANRGT
jgi:hypothetical protein